MPAKKIIITKDGRKKADLVIKESGKIEFAKDTIVINDECADCKAKDLFLLKMKAGNPGVNIERE